MADTDTKKYTTNYNLVKPGQDDFYNVDDFNSNADKIDEVLHTHITATKSAHLASAISSTATGDISATNVQEAIAELASEKASLSGATFTGAINETTTSIASASTMNIGAANANVLNVTGSATITAFDDAAQGGARRLLYFNSPLTINHSAKLILPSGKNLSVAAGDWIEFTKGGEAGVWFLTKYQPWYGFAPAKALTPMGAYVGDWNIAPGGIYTVDFSQGTNTPPADYRYGTLVCYRSYGYAGGGSQTQVFYGHDGSGQIWVRRTWDTGNWSPWKQIPTMDLVAPAGYGLGEKVDTSHTVTLNSITNKTGFFFYSNSDPNKPDAGDGQVIIQCFNETSIKQTAFSWLGATYQRQYASMAWSPWKELATRDMITDLGMGSDGAIYITDLDANNYRRTGLYCGWNIKNAPTTTAGVLTVKKYNNSYCEQTFQVVDDDSYATFVRVCKSNVWTAWKQVATKDMITDYGLGTNTPQLAADSNFAVLSGWYFCGNGSLNTPRNIEYGTLLVSARDTYGNLSQKFYPCTSNDEYIRNRYNGVWTPWKQIATADQIPITDDLARRFCGRNTPVMTQLVDWDAMANAVKVSSVKNLNNTATGIVAYGGDSHGVLGIGDIYLKQSYKNFDAILIIGCNDDANISCYIKWEKWELEQALKQGYRFNLYKNGNYGGYWNVWSGVQAGTTTHLLSTETVLYCQDQNCGIIEIYGLNY